MNTDISKKLRDGRMSLQRFSFKVVKGCEGHKAGTTILLFCSKRKFPLDPKWRQWVRQGYIKLDKTKSKGKTKPSFKSKLEDNVDG